MPLRGREENESEFHPRYVARRGNEGGQTSGLTSHGEADPCDDAVRGAEKMRVQYSPGRRDETELLWCVKPESQAG